MERKKIDEVKLKTRDIVKEGFSYKHLDEGIDLIKCPFCQKKSAMSIDTGLREGPMLYHCMECGKEGFIDPLSLSMLDLDFEYEFNTDQEYKDGLKELNLEYIPEEVVNDRNTVYNLQFGSNVDEEIEELLEDIGEDTHTIELMYAGIRYTPIRFLLGAAIGALLATLLILFTGVPSRYAALVTFAIPFLDRAVLVRFLRNLYMDDMHEGIAEACKMLEKIRKFATEIHEGNYYAKAVQKLKPAFQNHDDIEDIVDYFKDGKANTLEEAYALFGPDHGTEVKVVAHKTVANEGPDVSRTLKKYSKTIDRILKNYHWACKQSWCDEF